MPRVAISLLLVAACAAWVLSSLDLTSAWHALGGARWSWLAPALGSYLAAHLARSHRLRVLLANRIGTLELFRANAIGYMAIAILPLRLGELVRPQLLWQHYRLPLPACISAIAVERVLDLGGLLILLLSSAFLGGVLRNEDALHMGRKVGLMLGLGTLSLIVVGLVTSGLLHRMQPTRPDLSLFGSAAKVLLDFREGVSGLFRQPSALSASVVDTLFVYAFSIGATWCVLLAFDGVPHDIVSAAVLLCFTTIGMSAAPTPGGLGAFEASGLAALVLQGSDNSIAATVAIVLHLAQLCFSLGLGAISMLAEGIDWTVLAGARKSPP